MKNEKEYTEGIYIKKNKFLTWLENFWFYHKWHTIVTVFLVAVFGICLVQCVMKEEVDIVVTYAGPKDFVTSAQEKVNINTSFSHASVEQYGEGASVNLNSYIIYSEEQIKEIEKEVDEKGQQKYKVNTAQITQNMQELESFSTTGQSYIYLLDPYVYEHLTSKSVEPRFVPLKDVFGEKPSCAYDDYAVKLVDTDFYKNTPALHVLPEDTLICLHAAIYQPFGDYKGEHQNHANVFKKLAKISEEDLVTETQETAAKKETDTESE